MTMKNLGAHHDLYRRIKLSFREIAGTVLLTLAACGFLIAALYGGGFRTGADKAGSASPVETVTIRQGDIETGRTTGEGRATRQSNLHSEAVERIEFEVMPEAGNGR